MHYSIFNSILGLYPIGVSNTIPVCDNQTCLQTLSDILLGTESPLWPWKHPSKGCHLQQIHLEDLLPERAFLHWLTRVSMLNLQFKTHECLEAPHLGNCSKDRPHNHSSTKKGRSPTAWQIPLNVPSRQVLRSLGSPNLTLLLRSTREIILNIADSLAFHLQSLTH